MPDENPILYGEDEEAESWQENATRVQKNVGGLNLTGCASILIIAVGIIGTLIYVAQRDSGVDDDCAQTAGVSLDAKCVAPTQTTSASTSDDESPGGEATASEDVSESAGESGEPQTSADLGEDGVGAPGGNFGPPANSALPDGAVLYTGTSGGRIGCITCDGQSRFLSIEGPGVVVGDEGMTSQATTWLKDGQFLEFGANVSGPNKGRYGFNLFSGPATYFNGCSMEIGSTSCLQARPGPVSKGTPLVIIIGEGGTMVDNKPASKGDFVVDWWFVFQPE